jgi:alpha-1,3/alpha-1,6-mannosyltransferase
MTRRWSAVAWREYETAYVRVFVGQADTLVASSKFTARITAAHLRSITSTRHQRQGVSSTRRLDSAGDRSDRIASRTFTVSDAVHTRLSRQRPTLISLNRVEMKKNAALAIDAFTLL